MLTLPPSSVSLDLQIFFIESSKTLILKAMEEIYKNITHDEDIVITTRSDDVNTVKRIVKSLKIL